MIWGNKSRYSFLKFKYISELKKRLDFKKTMYNGHEIFEAMATVDIQKVGLLQL